GTKGMVHCLQDLEDFLSLQGEGCASSQEGRNRIVICAEPLDGRNALFPEPVKWLRFDVGEQGTLYFRFDFHVFFLSRICEVGDRRCWMRVDVDTVVGIDHIKQERRGFLSYD